MKKKKILVLKKCGDWERRQQLGAFLEEAMELVSLNMFVLYLGCDYQVTG